jgi:hypothetical protein
VIPGWRYEHTLAAAFLGCCAATGSILGAAHRSVLAHACDLMPGS